MDEDDNPIYTEMQAQFKKREAALIDEQVSTFAPDMILKLEKMLEDF